MMAECTNVIFVNDSCCSGAGATEPCTSKQHDIPEMLKRLEIYKNKVTKDDYKRAKWVIENTGWGITLTNKKHFYEPVGKMKIKTIDVNSRFFQIEYHAE